MPTLWTTRVPRRLLAASWRRLLVYAVVATAIATALSKLSLGSAAIVASLEYIRQLGPRGVPLLFACESAAFLLLLPIWPLHVGIGFLYGPWLGSLLAWMAYGVGCVPPFLLARMPLLAERFKLLRRRADMLDGVFSAVESEPFKLIVCLRLSPMLPSTLNSYLLGLTGVSLRVYVTASLTGTLPNTCAYVYLGTLLDSLADIAAGRVKRSPLSWALLLTGCAATVVALVYVTRAATRRVNAASRRGCNIPASPPPAHGAAVDRGTDSKLQRWHDYHADLEAPRTPVARLIHDYLRRGGRGTPGAKV
jgi:uncharacterized membrane protein YdjX (TVP38/TMEM64 family)